MKPKLIRILGLPPRVILLVLTPFLAMLPSQKAQAFCNQDTPFGIKECPGNRGGHQDINSNALGFLRKTIFDDIVDEHLFQDTANAFKDYIHFDNSRFVEGVNYINSQYSEPRNFFGAGGVVAELDPSSPQPFDATDEFGQLLHTAQDFYSHSNWVDYDPNNVPLFDSGIGLWTVPTRYGIVNRGTTNLIVVEGNFPFLTFTRKPTTPGEPRRLVDVALDLPLPFFPPIPLGQGLVSGAFGSGNQAPPGATIPHGSEDASDDLTSLNKDNSNRTNYQPAFFAAQRQTEQEWCRLLNLTKSKYGLKGASVPMALWVDPKGSPHPSSTACHDSSPGFQNVQVSIDSIKVLNDTDPFGSGELNFSFVLYTDDFTKSVRNEVNSISVSSGNFVPTRRLPPPLSLGLNNPNDLVITLQGWDDDNISSSFDGVFDESDDVLRGVTLDFSGGNFNPGAYKITSKDLEVSLTISSPRSVPEPTSALGLLAFGTLGVGSALKRKLSKQKSEIAPLIRNRNYIGRRLNSC